MDNKLHYAHTFFCGHLAAVGRASEVQAADKRWQAEKPLTREAYERLSSIYYESFIDSLMQVDGQTSGAVYADTAHLTLETDRLCTLRHPKLPAAEYAFRLCRFHLFFFPYDICLFAMEIAEEPETTLVAGAVQLFIRAGMTQGSFDKLLQTGEYTVREKWTNRRVGWFAGAYWCLVTAVYLAVSFWNNNWEKSWIIWAVAGLVFAALYSAVRAWADRKNR